MDGIIYRKGSYYENKKNVNGVFVMILTMFMSTIVYAADNASGNSVVVSPRIIVSYTKTVAYDYNSYSAVPSSVSYSEYSEAYKTTCKGTLYVQSVIKYGSVYRATFKGTLVGNI